jgi:hypothetical protein
VDAANVQERIGGDVWGPEDRGEKFVTTGDSNNFEKEKSGLADGFVRK